MNVMNEIGEESRLFYKQTRIYVYIGLVFHTFNKKRGCLFLMKHLKKLAVIFIFFSILCFPEISIKGSKDGLLLWYDTVVPTLLPFIILSNTLISVDAISYFTYLFYPIYRIFPKLLDCLASLLIIGFFCGYPMGAKMIDDFIATGKMTRTQGTFLLCICNNASPMFLTGYVVIATLKGAIPTSVFLFCIYCPVFLFFLVGIIRKPNLLQMPMTTSYPSKHPMIHDEMDIMTNSFFVILKIGGYMMLFSILSRFLLLLPISNYPTRAILLGLSEVTTGIRFLSLLTLPLNKKIALIGAAAAFGGFSSIAQTKSVLTQSKLSIFPYIISKFIFCITTYFLLYGYLLYCSS